MVDGWLVCMHNTDMDNKEHAMKKWYVFDQFDCITNCATAAKAAVEAEHLAGPGEMSGVHIVQMTQDQFNHYVTHNDLAAALKQ